MDIKNINLNRFQDLIKIYKASKFQFDPFLQNEDSELVDYYKQGNKIKIKKENRGKFTDYCGGKVTSECIQKGKNSPNPKIRKRATFAENARKWSKKQYGGSLLNPLYIKNNGIK